MKYKVGDKVRVREDLKVGDGFGRTTAVVDMLKYRGKIVTIKEARSSLVGNYTIYEIDDDDESWAWTDEMLEPAYADGGYVPYHKIPTPSKPVPIEEQLGLQKGVSIHDLPTAELIKKEFNVVWIDKIALPTATETKEMVERVSREILNFTNAFPKEKKKLKFTFYTIEGYRMDKSNNTKIPTVTTEVVYKGKDGCATGGSATCDKADYNERQGVLEAIANSVLGNFDREYNKAVKDNARADKKARTCTYCGQLFDTVAEKEEHEAWHVERRKARHERYLLRKRAKEIAFEEAAQKLAKEIIAEDKKK